MVRRRGFRRSKQRMWLLALCVIAAACGGAPEEPAMTDSAELSSSEEHRAEELSPTPPPSATFDAPQNPEMSDPSSARGMVLAGKELGMVVTGVETGMPSRSLDVLEGQILSFLPQLQEAYEREREQDPGLMGSLDVSLTIDPEGTVSDLRFPRTRVSNEKLITAVFDRMRTWTFPPADGRVQVRYSLLFVPPGVDHASIMTWEKYLSGRMVMDRSGEEDRPSVATATAPEPEPVEKPLAKAPAPTRAKPVKRPTPPAPARTATARRPVEPPVLGWYRITRPAALHAAPRDASNIVAQLRPGTRVRVVDVNGEWLEVRSVSSRPPGFLRRGYARPDAEVSRAREGNPF